MTSADRPERVRPPAVSGLFYPADPDALAAAVRGHLARAGQAAERGTEPTFPPKAIVVPHAGYVYSGDVAAAAYRLVAAHRGVVRRVVVLGPAHRVALRGMALPSVDAFATPLGLVPVDTELRARLRELPGVTVDDLPHAEEHALEVHLPFLQETLGLQGWTVLPVVVGNTSPEAVATLLDEVWGGDETLIVVSSDLSHYEAYASACAHDRATAGAIVAQRGDAIGPRDACGVYPLRGLLVALAQRQLPLELLALANSGDTAGPRDRVVGYGAFAVPAS